MKTNLNCDFKAFRRFRVCAEKMLAEVPVPCRQRIVGRMEDGRDIVQSAVLFAAEVLMLIY